MISAANQTFPLSAREAKIQIDIEAMLDEAVRRGRSGGVLARTWRAVSGRGGRRAPWRPTCSTRARAVQRIVDRVRVAVSRKAIDAKVEFKPQAVEIRHSRTGRTIDAVKLRSDDPDGARRRRRPTAAWRSPSGR